MMICLAFYILTASGWTVLPAEKSESDRLKPVMTQLAEDIEQCKKELKQQALAYDEGYVDGVNQEVPKHRSDSHYMAGYNDGRDAK
jgi:hypothetical protein